MREKHLKSLRAYSTAASYGIGIGVILFIFGLIVNDSIFAAVGAGIAVAFMVLFGFGMSLSLMEEFTEKSKGNWNLKTERITYSEKS